MFRFLSKTTEKNACVTIVYAKPRTRIDRVAEGVISLLKGSMNAATPDTKHVVPFRARNGLCCFNDCMNLFFGKIPLAAYCGIRVR